jgi:hypothetical protein
VLRETSLFFHQNQEMKKTNLPAKLCPVCQRPFTWRKKWERCWEEVKYCSDRCRTSKQPINGNPSMQQDAPTKR